MGKKSKGPKAKPLTSLAITSIGNEARQSSRLVQKKTTASKKKSDVSLPSDPAFATPSASKSVESALSVSSPISVPLGNHKKREREAEEVEENVEEEKEEIGDKNHSVRDPKIVDERDEVILSLLKRIKHLEKVEEARIGTLDMDSTASRGDVMENRRLMEEKEWNKTKEKMLDEVKKKLESLSSQKEIEGVNLKEHEWKRLSLEWRLLDMPVQFSGLLGLGKPLKSLPIAEWKSANPPECAKNETTSSPSFQKKVREWVKKARSDLRMLFAVDGQFDGSIALISACRSKTDGGKLVETILRRSTLELESDFRNIQSWLAWILISYGGDTSFITDLMDLTTLSFVHSSSVVEFKTEWMARRQDLERTSRLKGMILDPKLLADIFWQILIASPFRNVILEKYVNQQFLQVFSSGDFEEVFKLLYRHEENLLAPKGSVSMISQESEEESLEVNAYFKRPFTKNAAKNEASTKNFPRTSKGKGKCFYCSEENHSVFSCPTIPRCKHGRAKIFDNQYNNLTKSHNLNIPGYSSFEEWSSKNPSKLVQCNSGCTHPRYGKKEAQKIEAIPGLCVVCTEGSKELNMRIGCKIGDVCLQALVDTGADISVCSVNLAKKLLCLKLADRIPDSSPKTTVYSVDKRIIGQNSFFIRVLAPIWFLEANVKSEVLVGSLLLVLEESSVDLILGIDLLNKASCIIDFPNKKLMFGPSAGICSMQSEETIVKDAIKALSLDHLSMEHQASLRSLLTKYWKAFASNPEAPKGTTEVAMKIDTGDSEPVTSKNRPIFGVKLEALKRQIQVWLAGNKIVRSRSPWTSQPLLIPKGEGFRTCIDFRALNAVTRSEDYPIIHVSVLLEKLRGGDWFSSLDLASAYLQIPIEEASRSKTAFSTPFGKFEFCYVAFGLKNAPAVFNEFFSEVLSRVSPVAPPNFFDDCAVATEGTFEEHLAYLEKIFVVMIDANLQFKLQKCRFGAKSIKFCGFIVTKDGTTPSSEGTEAILKLPPPRSVTQIQSFLGSINYFRSYIPKFSSIAQPLYDLTRKNTKWRWTSVENEAFESLKKMLTSAPILAFPDFAAIKERPFRLTSDASLMGIGGVLEQEGLDGMFHPIFYLSRSLVNAEKNWNIVELEALGLYWCCEQLYEYLCVGPFDVRTDHKPLLFLLNQQAKKRIRNWLLSIAELPIRKITHIKGKDNLLADVLSRFIPIQEDLKNSILDGSNILLNAMEESNMQELLAMIEQSGTKVVGAIEEVKEKRKRGRPRKLVGSGSAEESLPPREAEKEKLSEEELQKLAEEDAELAKALQKMEFEDIGLEDDGEDLEEDEQKLLLEPVFQKKFPSREEILEAQKQDKDCKELMDILKEKEVDERKLSDSNIFKNVSDWKERKTIFGLRSDGILVRLSIFGAAIVIPEPLRKDIILFAHSSLLSAHEGVEKTLQRLRRSCWWPSMRTSIQVVLSQCLICKCTRPAEPSITAIARPISNAADPGDTWHLDFLGPLPAVRGRKYKHVLVAMDEASNFVEVKVATSQNAKTVLKLLFELVCKWGVPRGIRTDNGAAFTDARVKRFLEAFDIIPAEIPSGHHQSNGKVERIIGVLQRVIMKKLAAVKRPADWLDCLLPAIAAINMSTSWTLENRISPFEMMVGRAPRSLFENSWNIDKTELEKDEWGEKNWKCINQQRLDILASKKLRERLKKEENAKLKREKVFKKNDLVLVRNYNAMKTGQEQFVSSGNTSPIKSSQSYYRKGRIISEVTSSSAPETQALVYKVLLDDNQRGALGRGYISKREVLVHVDHLLLCPS